MSKWKKSWFNYHAKNILENVKYSLDNFPLVDAVFLDLKRAFDKVDHHTVYYCLD